MSLNVIELVQETLGESLTPDVIDQVSRWRPDDAWVLHEAVQEWGASFVLPERGSDASLRPYLSHTHSQIPHVFIDDPMSPFAVSDWLKHLLLYAHGLVIECELPSLVRNMVTDGRNPGRGLSMYLAMLYDLGPLIQNGTIVFVPLDYGSSPSPLLGQASGFRKRLSDAIGSRDGWSEWLDALSRQLAPEIDVSDYPMFFAATSGRGGESLSFNRDALEGRRHLVIEAFNYLSAATGFLFACDDNADLWLPHRHHESVLDALCSSRALHREPSGGIEGRLLAASMSVDVPAIGGLTAAMMVRLRQESEEFTAWRQALTRALTALHSLDPSTLLSTRDRALIVSAELEDVASRLAASDVGRSWGAQRGQAWRRLSIGALGLGATSVIGGFGEAAVVAGLAGVLGEVLAEAVLETMPRPQHATQLGHYLVFSTG